MNLTQHTARETKKEYDFSKAERGNLNVKENEIWRD
jgi:hypothetical protein